jgi:two-component system nitrogen regulation response regulator GlnG
MAPAQVIEVKDLPPEVLSLAATRPEEPMTLVGDAASTFSGFETTPSAAAPVAGAAVVPAAAWVDAPEMARTVEWDVDGPVPTWEAGLRVEALSLLDAGRTDVWDALGRRFETALIQAALGNTRGRRIEAAHKLGIGRNTITRKIQELGLEE